MFSLFPTDPKKALLQTTGLAILAGADPGQALSQLPTQIAQIKNQAEEMELRRAQLGIAQSQLEIQKREEERNAAVQAQKQALGDSMKAFNLSPSTFGGFAPGTLPSYQGTKNPNVAPTDWSANDMVDRTFKADNAMPIGMEGNPMAKRIMDLPLAVRQGLANAPLAAAEVLSPGLQNSVEDALTQGGSTGGKAPNVVNLRMPDGTTKAFDIGEPVQRQAAQQALTQGAIEVNPETPKDTKPQVVSITDGKAVRTLDLSNPQDYDDFQKSTDAGWWTAPTQTLNQETKDPNADLNATYTKQINDTSEQRAAVDAEVDKMTAMGSLLLAPDMYTGTGGSIVNGVGKALQDTMGLFPGTDFSKPVNAEQIRKSLALGLKQTLLKGEQNMAVSDRQYLDSMIAGMGDGPKAISRGIAMKMLESRYLAQKDDFLQEAVRDGKMNHYQAIKAWNKQKSAVIQDIFNPQNIDALMTNMMDGANDQTFLEYAKTLAPGAEQQIESQLGVTPESTATPQAPVVLQGSPEEMDAQWRSLQKGTEYRAPDGSIRKKQ